MPNELTHDKFAQTVVNILSHKQRPSILNDYIEEGSLSLETSISLLEAMGYTFSKKVDGMIVASHRIPRKEIKAIRQAVGILRKIIEEDALQ